MSLTTSEMTPADIAAVTRGGNDNGFGDGNGAWWLIVLFLFAMGGWGNGFGGNGGGNGNIPWIMNTDNDVERGFNQMATTNALSNLQTAVSNGFANASTQLCNCCSDTQMALANGFAGVEQGANARQMSNMQSMFNLQSQLADCCCENRLGTADLKYTIATENCADRQALNEGVRDIIASNTASTQAILDKLCQQEIDAKNDTIATLRQELLYARGQASQEVQTATLRASQATTANELLSEMRACPIPAQPVYGSQPIFTCNQNSGCGCGA